MRSHQPEWKISAATRTVDRGGTSIRIFEFCADITEYRSVLILSDGWEVLAETDQFPENWRDLSFDALLSLLESHTRRNPCTTSDGATI